jgi:hypothetical protein
VGHLTGGPGARIAAADADRHTESWSFVAAMTDEPILRQAFLDKAMGVVDDE